MFSSLYPDTKPKFEFDDYPDIFKVRFLDFRKIISELRKDSSWLKIFVMAASNANLDEKLNVFTKMLVN